MDCLIPLLVTLALATVVLHQMRTTYWRSEARFHERQAERYQRLWQQAVGTPPEERRADDTRPRRRRGEGQDR